MIFLMLLAEHSCKAILFDESLPCSRLLSISKDWRSIPESERSSLVLPYKSETEYEFFISLCSDCKFSTRAFCASTSSLSLLTSAHSSEGKRTYY